MARIFISPDGSERSFREPRERCYCGAEDCPRCYPGNVRDARGERDPDQERDEQLDREAEEWAERRRYGK